MRLLNKILSIFLIFTLTACATKEGSGTAFGAVAGGLIGTGIGSAAGSSTGGLLIGSALGALAGNAVGRQLDANDRKILAEKTQDALETSQNGKSLPWINKKSGNKGYITPSKPYKSKGRYCREYVQLAQVGGDTVKIYGTACRQADGQWEILNSHTK